jgi:hypothetical protein
MARRSGKAISRRERQRRRAQQATTRPLAARPAEPGLPGDAPAAPAEHAAEAQATATPRPRAAEQRFSVGGSSRLTERAIAEYHYVGRDLRNIGVLVVILTVMLAVAAIGVNVLGINQV